MEQTSQQPKWKDKRMKLTPQAKKHWKAVIKARIKLARLEIAQWENMLKENK